MERRLNPENGVLPQKLAAIAMVLGGVKLPDVSDGRTYPGVAWKYSDSWELGFGALYQVGLKQGLSASLLSSSNCLVLI